MDRFVSRSNIDCYRRLADETTDAIERLRILQLLAEQKAQFRLEFKSPPEIARHEQSCRAC